MFVTDLRARHHGRNQARRIGDALRAQHPNATIAGGHGAIAKQADIGPALAAN